MFNELKSAKIIKETRFNTLYKHTMDEMETRARQQNLKLKKILTSTNNFQGPASRQRVFNFFLLPIQNISRLLKKLPRSY